MGLTLIGPTFSGQGQLVQGYCKGWGAMACQGPAANPALISDMVDVQHLIGAVLVADQPNEGTGLKLHGNIWAAWITEAPGQPVEVECLRRASIQSERIRQKESDGKIRREADLVGYYKGLTLITPMCSTPHRCHQASLPPAGAALMAGTRSVCTPGLQTGVPRGRIGGLAAVGLGAMGWILVRVVGVAAIAYLGICIALYSMQRSLLYFPQSGSMAGGAGRLRLSTDAGDVLVTTRQLEGSTALIYFGGNAEDVSANLPGLAAVFPDVAIYLLHYRGYAGSAGSPSETGLVNDALTLFDYVRARHTKIFVIGRSLGSGVAVQLASLRPIDRLVLVTPFNSIQELAVRQFPYIPVAWLLQDKYESWKYAKRITAKTLLIVAEQDETIPRSSSDSLFSHFQSGVASMKVITGSGHNSIPENEYYAALIQGLH